MDLEDLISPSKVSKETPYAAPPPAVDTEAPQDHSDTEGGDNYPCSTTSSTHEDQDRNRSGGSSGSGSAGGAAGSSGRRTTRGKRPRSGDDFEMMSTAPERKRELRSSAGRLAAAAAARHAAEAKMAASETSLNLSVSSADEHQQGNE